MDLTKELPQNDDFELRDDVDEEPDDNPDDDNSPGPHKPIDGKHKRVAEEQLEQPRSIRRRFYGSPKYWQKRALGGPTTGPHPRGRIRPHVLREFPSSVEPPNVRRKPTMGKVAIIQQ